MTAPTDDRALVIAAQGGDRGAMDRLLRHHYDRIYAVCRRITGNDADAADAAQEALMAIVRGLSRFDGRSSFATWVYRVATNASLDELRRRRRRPALSVVGDDDRTHAPNPTAHDLDDRIGDRLGDRLRLEAALADLPEEFRVAVVLRDVADLDYAEIAEVLAVPVGTVKSRIARGRTQLSAVLTDDLSGDLSGDGNHGGTSERPTSVPRSSDR